MAIYMIARWQHDAELLRWLQTHYPNRQWMVFAGTSVYRCYGSQP